MADNNKDRQKGIIYNDDCTKVKIREEQLEISKELAQTGDVDMHVESVTEMKTVTVPVIRKELVIEKKVFDKESQDEKDKHTEIIRIPIIEERIEVVKHMVKLEDVSIYKNKFQEIEHIEQTLKKEKVNIETSGDVRVIES